jgi:hypothetical protein
VTLGELHLRYREKMQETGFPEAFNDLLQHHFAVPSHFVWTRPDLELPREAANSSSSTWTATNRESPWPTSPQLPLQRPGIHGLS